MEESPERIHQKYMRGEWLNLRLGRKVFYCKFCNREFYSSQALGGHQNAHKREKTMLQHCLAAAATTTARSSLGVQVQHNSHVHILGVGAAATASNPGVRAARHSFDLQYFQELQNFADPGSFRQEERYPSSNPDMLDLDLKL